MDSVCLKQKGHLLLFFFFFSFFKLNIFFFFSERVQVSEGAERVREREEWGFPKVGPELT